MKHDVPTDESQETAALYALGALSQLEARAFEIHLRQGCHVCQRELNEFTGVVVALSSSSIEVTPPAYLRDLLSARIVKESNLPMAASPFTAQVVQFPEKLQTPSSVLVHRSSFNAWLPWAAAAVLLIAFAFTFLNWQKDHRQLQAVSGQNVETQQQLAQMREQVAYGDARTRELEQINAVLSAPQRSVIPMNGLEAAPSASGNVYWDLQKNRWVVIANLPPAPAGKVYQLWMVTPESKISAGLIEQDARGHGFIIVDLPPNTGQIQAAAITLEPQGGSPQPTMPIYAIGKTTA